MKTLIFGLGMFLSSSALAGEFPVSTDYCSPFAAAYLKDHSATSTDDPGMIIRPDGTEIFGATVCDQVVAVEGNRITAECGDEYGAFNHTFTLVEDLAAKTVTYTDENGTITLARCD